MDIEGVAFAAYVLVSLLISFFFSFFFKLSIVFESAYTLTTSLPNGTMLQIGGLAPGRASWSINQIHVVAEGCQRLFHWEAFHLWCKGRILILFWKCIMIGLCPNEFTDQLVPIPIALE